MTSLLAVDTANRATSVALYVNGRVYSAHEEAVQQAEQLVPMIQRICVSANKKPEEIDHFAINIGPGSFTGIRVGVSALKAYAFALKKKIIPVTSLHLLAYLSGKAPVTVLMHAGKNQVYAQEFSKDIKPISDIKLVDIEAVKPENFVTNEPALKDKIAFIESWKAEDILHMLQAHPHLQTPQSLDAISPLYVRPPDAKLPTHG